MTNTTIPELIEGLYEMHRDHFDFMDNMNGGDCDCVFHLAMNLFHNANKEANNGSKS